ncbi:TniQ family protein [Aliiroseovarius sp. F47248L]|uniref:TniQ family protein n=1 Tax=Aliiroseovarius sp. F47248L TaxID=2926420 RepID=UPI00248B2CD1|nr:TniQ family protein [Aliiroseovarius sp. F47248L]
MTLWPSLNFDRDETLLSYADRLSMMHTGCGMERLVKDLGINIEHFTSGREDAVSAFAGATGLHQVEAHKAAIRVLQRGASFRGEPVSKNFLSPRVARCCPVCLEEDGDIADRRFRVIWGFRHVARCDLHSLWLEDVPFRGETSVRRATGQHRIEARRPATPEIPEYLSWLRARLTSGFPDESKWLEGQSLEQVLGASEMLGAVLQHGHKVALKNLSSAQMEEATDIGFSIYVDGRGAVEEALDTIRAQSPATAVQAGPLAHYGKLYDWLDRRSNSIDPGPIRDILRDHIVKNTAVEPGTMLLGLEISERKFHTLYSLSFAVGIRRPRLARLLKKLGLIPEDATEIDAGNMIFEAEKTVPLIEAFKSAIPLHDVPTYLGASKGQVETLYRIGAILPLVPRTERGSVRNVVFGKKHLDDILTRISDLPVLEDLSSDTLHQLSYASQRGAGRFELLFQNILDGKSPGFRHPERTGISSIYVDVSALIASR